MTRNLVFAFDPQKASIVLSFLLFNHSLPYLRLIFHFLNAAKTVYIFLAYLYPRRMLLLSFLRSKNVSRALFMDCLVLNALFSFFRIILICKYVSHMYLVSV